MSNRPRRAALVCALALAFVAPLAAQSAGPGSPPLPAAVILPLVPDLPVDSLADALGLWPGVTLTRGGGLSVRGGGSRETAVVLDGVPIASGYRGLGPGAFQAPFLGAFGAKLSLGTEGLGAVSLDPGPAAIEHANARSGVVDVTTRRAGAGWAGGFAYESDEPFGSARSLGLNRLQAHGAGPLGGGLSLAVSGVLIGQRSAPTGFGALDAPIFEVAGIDTTVAVPSGTGPVPDATFVDVMRFAVGRGHCESVEGSADPGIASNYGLPCRGIRTPASALSVAQGLGRLDWDPTTGTHLFLSAAASQDQRRRFDYAALYNPQQLGAARLSSRVVTLGLRQRLAAARPLTLEAWLSHQADRAMEGPLTLEGERSSRDPFGGFLVAPLDLRFDWSTFPVDDALVDNVRRNTPGSRRSPYDLENPGQYALVNSYRSNAYGLFGFSEGGGPVGRLTLLRENRLVARAALDRRWAKRHGTRIGGEWVRYAIDNYSHALTSQAFSDVYRERPVRLGAFLEERLAAGPLDLTGGIRYDRFDTRASRAGPANRISSSPGFDPANPTSEYVRDAAHGAVSGSLRADLSLGAGTSVRASAASVAQVPDFALGLAGINTDLAITNRNQVFGSDLDFERTETGELGIRRSLGTGIEADLALFVRRSKELVEVVLVTEPDPLNNRNVDLFRYQNRGRETAKGLELTLARSAGALRGIVSYGYQDVRFDGTSIPTADSRPHTVSGAAALTAPDGWGRGSLLGALFGNSGLFVVVRVSTGTAYTACIDQGVPVTLAGDPCVSFTGERNDARLPPEKRLDLRLTRSVRVAGGTVTLYADARNLLNLVTQTNAFAANGEITSSVEAQAVWSRDSIMLAAEAQRSGARLADGSIDFRFGGGPDPRAGCGSWVNQGGRPAAPNCVYLIRAEERFGNGDHVYDLAEQRRASTALYQVSRGRQAFTGSPRLLRVGAEVRW